MSRRPRKFSDARRVDRPKKEPRRSILVLCEGEVTEYEYLDEMRHRYRNSTVEVRIHDQHGVPKTLVEIAAGLKKGALRAAKREKDAYLAWDDVWCVFDVDEHPNIPDAKQQARDNDIRLAISNPCFELWVLLHFQDQASFIDRKQAQRKVKVHIPRYVKSLPYDILDSGYESAVRRSQELNRRCAAASEENRNPSCTGIVRLTRGIRHPDGT